MSSSAFAIGKVLRDASMIAARNAAIAAATQPHQGMQDAKAPRINPATGRTMRGLGYYEPGDYFDDYAYGYDSNGYWMYDDYYLGNGDGGGGGDVWYDPSFGWSDGWDLGGASEPTDWQGNTDIFAWNWDENTSYWDEQNQGWWDMSDPTNYTFTDSDGSQYSVDPMTGDAELIAFSEPTTAIDPGDLQTTLDWWGSITGDANADAVVLPDPDTINWDYVGQIPGLGTSLPTLDLPSQIGPPPPKTADKNTKANWLKKAQEALKKAASQVKGGSPSGSPSSSAKPATVPPNAQGQCPSGYAKHPQTGQCVLIPKQQATSLQGLFANPWFLLAAAGVVAIIAKK